MDLMPPISMWFWVSAAASAVGCFALAVWTISSKRNWKLIPVQIICLIVVFGLTMLVSKGAAQAQVARMKSYYSGFSPLLGEELTGEGHSKISSGANSLEMRKVDGTVKRWLDKVETADAVVTVRKKGDSGTVVVGWLRDQNGKRPMEFGRSVSFPKEQLKEVWQGKSPIFVAGSLGKGGKSVWLASPIQNGKGEIESAAMIGIPVSEWISAGTAAQDLITGLGGVLSITVLVVTAFIAEVLHSMAILHVSKAETMLQNEKIREQMEVIAEKNQHLAKGRSELEEANAKLTALATLDGLTGVMNHRTLMEFLTTNMKKNSIIGSPCSVVLLDVDNFKQLNDQYGHIAGDDALRVIAHVLRLSTPEGCAVGRYGGEEFMMVLPGAAESAGVAVAEEIRKRIQGAPQQSRPCTVSVGVATVYSMTKSEQTLIDEADQALYHSKRNGKNKVTHFGHGLSDSA